MPHDIDILIEDDRWDQAGFAALAHSTLTHSLDALELAAEVSVLACDDVRIAALNTDFRDKASATNVLSWPSEERGAPIPGTAPAPPRPAPDGTVSLGDIAISYDTCLREAGAQDKPFAAHVTHLLVHGLLHLLGYDHIDDKDAALMEALEVKLLGKLGVADPY